MVRKKILKFIISVLTFVCKFPTFLHLPIFLFPTSNDKKEKNF